MVVPTRNRAALLADCLKTLADQDADPALYEVVVVDDGSIDDTRLVVEALSRRQSGPTIRYHRQSAQGLNAARNRGISATSAPLIAFVDDDVDVPKTWLSALLEGVRQHPDIGCFGGPIRLRLEGEPPRTCGAESLGTAFDPSAETRPVKRVFGANILIRRSAYERTGPFDETVQPGDEEEWQFRYRRDGQTVLFLPDAWLWHRRTVDDLRLRTLLVRSFKRGAGQVRFFAMVNEPLTWPRELRNLFESLGHAVLRRCWGGAMLASRTLGRMWGLLRAAMFRAEPLR